ncbi:MAG TPA: hypothetical protein VL295_08885 [Gemmatimonadales bacterium]|nr:hypothetical protein [Gemmatimonadales bacterium]
MHVRRPGLWLLASVLLAAPLQAQAPTYRIRLYEPWSIRIAPVVRTTTLASWMVDSLPLQSKDGRQFFVPRRHVMQIDSLVTVIPKGARVRHGAVSGGIIGAVVGVAFGALTASSSPRSVPVNAAVYGLGLGVGGSLLGAGFGALGSGETWETVWPLRP